MLGVRAGFHAYDVLGMEDDQLKNIPEPIIGIIVLYNTKVILKFEEYAY